MSMAAQLCRTASRCATSAPTASCVRPPTGPFRSTAASDTRERCRSSTSTATIAATGSPRAPARCRSGTSPGAWSCSANARPANPAGGGAGRRPAGNAVTRGRAARRRGPAAAIEARPSLRGCAGRTGRAVRRDPGAPALDPARPGPPPRRARPDRALPRGPRRAGRAASRVRARAPPAGADPSGAETGHDRPRRLSPGEPVDRRARRHGRPRLGAGASRRPAGGPGLAVRSRLAIRGRAAGGGRRRLRDLARLLPLRRRRRGLAGGAALVADRRHRLVGSALPRAGLPSPLPPDPVGRARLHRAPGVRAGVGCARNPPASMTEPHDLPDPPALLEAVREFLSEDVEPRLEGGLRYHLKVAINVLAIVERELRLGQEHSARHRERLKRLGFRSDAELAEAIRSGALDDRLEQVAGELREMVADKLAVARPNHNRR